MEEKVTYTKLKDLIDDQFTIVKVNGYNFKQWDNESKRMISEPRYFPGSRKLYTIETDKGVLDLSEHQLGSLFASCQHAGKSDLIGVVVGVKSNGKTGMDIRYYLNPLKMEKVKTEEESGLELGEMFAE